MEKLLTPNEAAQVLRVSRRQVYRIRDQIGCCRVGRGVRFREADLARFASPPAPRRTEPSHFQRA